MSTKIERLESGTCAMMVTGYDHHTVYSSMMVTGYELRAYDHHTALQYDGRGPQPSYGSEYGVDGR